MKRQEALELMKSRVTTRNLQKHILAVEAVMRKLAEHFGEDIEEWGLAGLLHDLDYEDTKDDAARHSMMAADWLTDMGLDEEIVEAVRAHNDFHGLPRETRMAKALYASDPLTGLIVASALIHPDRKLKGIDTDFVMNRFSEGAFARGANREAISTCQDELGISLEDFVAIALEAMQGIHKELGL